MMMGREKVVVYDVDIAFRDSCVHNWMQMYLGYRDDRCRAAAAALSQLRFCDNSEPLRG